MNACKDYSYVYPLVFEFLRLSQRERLLIKYVVKAIMRNDEKDLNTVRCSLITRRYQSSDNCLGRWNEFEKSLKKEASNV
jgi:hypothetical protein